MSRSGLGPFAMTPAGTRRSALTLIRTAPLAIALFLPACERPLPTHGDARIDAAVLEACRQRANEVYDRQNRASIYAPQYAGNSPLSGAYTEPSVTRGLSAQFAHQQMIRDCVRTANLTTEKSDAPVEISPSAPPPAAPTTQPTRPRR